MKNILFLATILASAIFAACASSGAVAPATAVTIKQVSVEQAKPLIEKGNVQFIDVRSEAEYKSGHAPQTTNIPLDSLEQNISKLDKNAPVYVICQSGGRSQKGAEILEKKGFTDVTNIKGGTSAWTSAGFPVEK